MKKKCLALCMAAAMAVGSLAGCGSGAKEPAAANSQKAGDSTETVKTEAEKTEAAATEGGSIKILFGGTVPTNEKEYLSSSFVQGFEEATGIEVEVDFLAQADAIKKIQTEQETGNVVADILFVDTANMAPYIKGGWVEDITAVVDGSGSTYTTMFDESTNKDGVRYFVPTSFDVYVTIANVKALDYLPEGLAREDVETGLTWEQFAEWANAIAAGEGQGKTIYPSSTEGSQLLYPMAGMSLAYGGGFPDFTSQGFKDAMGILASMAEGNAYYSEQAQYNKPTEPIDKGDVWLAFTHMGNAGLSYNAAPNNYVIGAAPSGSQGAGSTAGAWCFGIQKGSKNTAAAMEFIKYITDPEVNYDYCTNMGGVLSPIEEVGDILESSDVIMRAGIEMLKTTKISGVPSTEYTDWNAVKFLYNDVFNEILNTKAVPGDEFLNGVQEKLEALKVTE